MRKALKWSTIVSTVAGVMTSCIIYTVYGDVLQVADDMYTPVYKDPFSDDIDKMILEKNEPFAALILGVDERGADADRSDTMIVLTVNPTLQTTKLFSIPRDTYTKIVGENRHDKINHAYAYGGMEMSIKTVEHLLDIPIDFVTKINMESFVEIIDILGEIPVDNHFEFDYEGASFSQGPLLLDGERALKYVRMRYDDPDGDFGRQQRQKQVIQGVLQKGLTVCSAFQYSSILDVLKDNVEMNVTYGVLVKLQKNYAESIQSIEQLTFQQGIGKKQDGIYYYFVNDKELENLQIELKTHLQIY